MSGSNPFGLLAGVRVLDVGQYIPGPYACLMLSDLGAEVIKIEAPGGDPMRVLGPLDSDGVSPFYKTMNAGKTVVELDLKSPTGRGAFERLLRRADALVESYRPGVMERLGFAAPALEALNPALVWCSLSGFGQTGPYRLRADHDLGYLAFAGVLASTGTESTPVLPVPPVSDYASGLQAALTVLAALIGRHRSRRGARVDVSLAETVLAWQSAALTGAARSGHRYSFARGTGDESGGHAGYRIYATADARFVTLSAQETKFWRAFCEAVQRPDWVPRQSEPVPQTDLIAQVAGMFASRPLAHWCEVLDPADCCFEPVLEHSEIPDHPQVRARGMLSRETWPDPVVQALYPAWIDGAPPPRRPAPVFAGAETACAAWEAEEGAGC